MNNKINELAEEKKELESKIKELIEAGKDTEIFVQRLKDVNADIEKLIVLDHAGLFFGGVK